jgi:hypothetical protein
MAKKDLVNALLAVAFAALTVGCRGSLASSEASPDASPEWSPVCPATAPDSGTSCSDADSNEQLTCEYGDTPSSAGCAVVILECAGGVWGQTSPSPYGLTCPPEAGPPSSLPAYCPPNFASVPQGGLCPADGDRCTYDEAHVCVCINAEDLNDDDLPPPASNNWFCANSDPSCPPERPRIGSACSGEDGGGVVSCAYDGPLTGGAYNGVQVQCVGGVWTL